jgi:lycopene cyclase domain-containing protein
MPLYPTLSIVAALAVIAAERWWLRTGLFRQPAYWISMAIVFAFMIPIDGWMSKRSDPIVMYDDGELSGIRFPWDIPLEEFVYAFAVVTLAMVLWERAGTRESSATETGDRESVERP